jgi:hypothetical protein
MALIYRTFFYTKCNKTSLSFTILIKDSLTAVNLLIKVTGFMENRERKALNITVKPDIM